MWVKSIEKTSRIYEKAALDVGKIHSIRKANPFGRFPQ